MPLTFPTPTAARDDLDGLLLLGGQPTAETLAVNQTSSRRLIQSSTSYVHLLCKTKAAPHGTAFAT